MDQNILTKRNSWLDLFIFVLFLNVFFFHSFEIVALACFLSGLWVLLVRIFAKGIGQAVWWESGVMAVTVGSLLLVDSPEKIIVLLLFALLVMLVSVYSWLKQKSVGGLLELGLSGLIVIKEYLYSALLIVQGLMSGTLGKVFQLSQSKKQHSPWIRSIIVGGLVSLPLIAWLIATLAKADPVFAAFIQNIVSKELLTELPARLFFSVLAFLVLIPLLITQWRGYRSPLAWISKVSWGREITVVTAMITLVLGVFLIVQWPYVFVSVGHETELAKFGVATYSEYVQKGFWDLLKVVLMVFGISWVTVLLNRNQTGQEKRILLSVQGILGLEFIIFIASMFRRVWLYQSYHGLSLARLYGLAVLVLIVGLTVTMGLRYVSQRVRWVKVEMAWIFFMVLAVVGINMQGIVVKQPPTVNNRVDYVYLARLPGDGYEGWVKSYAWAQGVLEKYTNQPGELNKEQRREIFYAGAVSRQLTQNYHELIVQYGTDAEVKEYFKQVITTKKDILFTTSATELISIWGENKKPRSEVIDALSQNLADLEHTDWLDKVNITPIPRLDTIAQLYQQYPHQERDLTYYEVSRSKETERLQGLNAFFARTPAQNKTYHRMREDIGEAKLLTLQKQDMALRQRIGLQPEKERDFEMDISLESPFLD